MWDVHSVFWISSVGIGLLACAVVSTDMFGGVGVYNLIIAAMWLIFMVIVMVFMGLANEEIDNPDQPFFQTRVTLGWAHVILVAITLLTSFYMSTNPSIEKRNHLLYGAILSFMLLQIPLGGLYFYNDTSYSRETIDCGRTGAAGQKQFGLCYTPCQNGYCGVGPVCWRKIGTTCPMVIGNRVGCAQDIKSRPSSKPSPTPIPGPGPRNRYYSEDGVDYGGEDAGYGDAPNEDDYDNSLPYESVEFQYGQDD